MSGFFLPAGSLNRRITFQRLIRPAGAMSAGKGAWQDVATDVYANVQEMLPSRGERLVDGLRIASRPTRIRIRYREDITSDMRILYGARVMQIVAQPIELGRRVGLEMMAQDFSSAGNG